MISCCFLDSSNFLSLKSNRALLLDGIKLWITIIMKVRRKILSYLQDHFPVICGHLQKTLASIEYWIFDFYWAMIGYRKPPADDAALVASNVTFIFKSFERQNQARALVQSIKKYYPEARVVIADDSSVPLVFCGLSTGSGIRDARDDGVKVIQMPFNSGLSRGLNLALSEVKTPFLMRMDDDELLTRRSNIAGELKFLLANPEVDIVGIPPIDALKYRSLKKRIQSYFKFSMEEAPQTLKVPHGTRLDGEHVVLGKVPNIFLARTESIRKVGWDDNIRMIDHHDFFFRAAGVLVSVISITSRVFHNHLIFSPEYNRYRSDWKRDALYIRRTRHGSGIVKD